MSGLYQIFSIKSFLDSPIKVLKFSEKTNSMLIGQNISNFNDLFQVSANDLLKSDKTDDRCLVEIDYVISKLLKKAQAFNISFSEKIQALYTAWGKSMVDIPIEQLGLSIRGENCMRRAKVKTVGDLARKTPLELYQIKNLGKETHSEIVQKLKILLEMGAVKVLVIDWHISEEARGDLFIVPIAYMETSINEVPFNNRVQGCLQKLNIRNLGDLTKFKTSELLRMKNMGRRSIEAINNTLNKYYEESNTRLDIEKESLRPALSRIESCLSDREYYVLKKRMEGKTLREIGGNLNVSRERIRQLEVKAIVKLNKSTIGKRLVSFGETIVKILKKYDGMAGLFEVLQEMDVPIVPEKRSENVKDLRRLMNFLKFVEKKEFYEIKGDGVLKLSLYSESELKEAYRVLLGEIKDYIGSTKNEIRDGLSLEIAYTQKIEDYCIDKFIKKDGIYKGGKLVGRKNKPVDCMEHIFFSAGKALNLQEGFESYKTQFDSSISRRNADSLVTRAKNLILWGRGVYIHKNFIDLKLDQSGIIFERINKAIQNNEKKISVQSVFNNNQPLMKYIGLPTPYALYSWLRTDEKETYLLRKYPDIESPLLESFPRKQRDEELNEYFLTKNRIIFRDELIDHFVDGRGLLEHQVFFAMQRCLEIYRVGHERFVHKKLLKLSNQSIQILKNQVEKKLKDHSYLIVGQFIASGILPTINKCAWTNHLLADILRKNGKFKFVGIATAITREDNNLINNVEEVIMDIVQNAGHEFTKSSLAGYCRLNNVTMKPSHISKFISKYGFMLKN
jgi:hypothetical protein